MKKKSQNKNRNDRKKRISKNKNTYPRKDQKFEAKNLDPETSKRGIEMEKQSVLVQCIIWGLLIIGGIIIIFLGYKDNISFKGFGVEFSVTYVGLAVVIIGSIGLIKNKPKVKITE